MISFQYVRATDVADAVRQTASDPRARFVAGGTVTYSLVGADAAAFTINSSTGVISYSSRWPRRSTSPKSS